MLEDIHSLGASTCLSKATGNPFLTSRTKRTGHEYPIPNQSDKVVLTESNCAWLTLLFSRRYTPFSGKNSFACGCTRARWLAFKAEKFFTINRLRPCTAAGDQTMAEMAEAKLEARNWKLKRGKLGEVEASSGAPTPARSARSNFEFPFSSFGSPVFQPKPECCLESSEFTNVLRIRNGDGPRAVTARPKSWAERNWKWQDELPASKSGSNEQRRRP
jgi:hypothetical protein